MAHTNTMLCVVLITILSTTTVISGSTLTTSLTLLEQHAIAKILRQPPKDLRSVYYSATALTAIDKEVREPQMVCAFARDGLDKTNPESLMQYSTIVRLLQCKDAPIMDVGIDVAALITDDVEPVALAHLITAMANFGLPVDEELVQRYSNDVEV